MKKLLSIPALALLALFASCSSDDAVLPGGADGGRVGVSADIPAIGFEDDTRAALIFSSTGMEFKWQENDVLSIYPKYVEGKDLMFTEETSPREPWYIVSNEVIKQGKDGSWFAFFTDDEGDEILDVPNVTSIFVLSRRMIIHLTWATPPSLCRISDRSRQATSRLASRALTTMRIWLLRRLRLPISPTITICMVRLHSSGTVPRIST